MRAAHRSVGMVAGVLAAVLAVVAPALACAPLVQLRVTPAIGSPGEVVTLDGSGFSTAAGAGPVEIRSDMTPSGATETITTAPGPAFRLSLRVPPEGGAGRYHFDAIQRRLSDGEAIARAATVLYVNQPSPPPATVPIEPPPPSVIVQLPRSGYRLAGADGGIFAFGNAGFFGSTAGMPLNRPVVGMAATPTGRGYWLVGADGGIFAFGDAGFFGSTGGVALASPIVGMATTRTGGGYWLVGADGGIFAFGDAPFAGSAAGTALRAPVVGMDGTASGHGYWLVGADGGIFAFGDAPFLDSLGGVPLTSRVAGISRSSTGYWLVDSVGAVFPFGEGWTGDEPFDRSLMTHPVVGFEPTFAGRGHWLATSDGGVFAAFGAPFLGSAGGLPLAAPIVGITAATG